MKTINFKTGVLFVLMLISVTGYAFPIVNDSVANKNYTAMSNERGEFLIHRLKEIKSMDKSDLSRTEKRELRKEVKSIKAELTAAGKGIYLSIGAIIIVILLLILLV